MREPLLMRFVKRVLKVFKKKPTIINLNDTLEDNALYIANHSAASGPLTLSLYFPKKFIPWGTHHMCGNYKERWNYLYHVFYQQKLHYSKFRSFLIATPFALVSKMLYNWMRLIPTYQDARLIQTMKISIDHLEQGSSVLVFPENSSHGYDEILQYYHSGFISLARLFYKKTKRNIPLYAVYFSKKKNAIIIDKPIYIQDLLFNNDSKEEIAEKLKNRTNNLYEQLKEALSL